MEEKKGRRKRRILTEEDFPNGTARLIKQLRTERMKFKKALTAANREIAKLNSKLKKNKPGKKRKGRPVSGNTKEKIKAIKQERMRFKKALTAANREIAKLNLKFKKKENEATTEKPTPPQTEVEKLTLLLDTERETSFKLREYIRKVLGEEFCKTRLPEEKSEDIFPKEKNPFSKKKKEIKKNTAFSKTGAISFCADCLDFPREKKNIGSFMKQKNGRYMTTAPDSDEVYYSFIIFLIFRDDNKIENFKQYQALRRVLDPAVARFYPELPEVVYNTICFPVR
jgi:hypothetical protein